MYRVRVLPSRHMIRSLRCSSSVRSLLTISHAYGPTSPPLLESTVPAHFETIVSKFGSKTAIVSRHQQDRVSYYELHRRSNALAKALQKLGVQKGDRVGVSLGNSTEYAVTTYALFKLGAILTPLNPAFTELQVASALNHLTASHLIVGLETNLSRKPAFSSLPLIDSLLGSPSKASLVPSLRNVITVNNIDSRHTTQQLSNFPTNNCLISFEDLQNSESGEVLVAPAAALDSSDVVNIQFTSGTTSTPKAACLSHRSILNNGRSIGARMLFTHKDIIICSPPLFHCFGAIIGLMASVTHGASIVFPSEAFDPLACLRAVQEERATALYGVPTMFNGMLELIEDGTVQHKGFETLRTGVAAGSSIPAALMEKLHRILNLTELTICYGMTETSPVSCMTTTNDPMDMRLGSVGRLMPHVEAKVVSARDRTKVLPISQRGELVVNGYLVMNGYWKDQKRTDEELVVSADGKRWMHTGDEAEMTPDGYVRITGRLKDLIIRGGENIHPLEVENCILKHPGVSDVSVVGVEDERYGESVAAFVIRKATGGRRTQQAPDMADGGVDDIRYWVRDRMSKHLVPKHVFFVDSFPKTASGKVQKFILREQASSILARG